MFKTGDKVVCIDNSPGRNTNNPCPFNTRDIYEIEQIYIDCKGKLGLHIKGYVGIRAWNIKRFEKIIDNFAESVLASIKEQIEKEELVLI